MTLPQPELAVSPAQTCSEHTFRSWDGCELFYRHWKPPVPSLKSLLLFHRGHEHSGRFEDFVGELGLPDVHVFAWDARGHGRSPGERGYAPSFAAVVRDMDAFVRHLGESHDLPVEEMIALGHSVGAVAVAAWVHDYGPPLRAMVLVTPAFRVKLYVPFALPALRLRTKLGGRSFIKSYVRPRMLTHDEAQVESYRSDPLISKQIATNILIDLHDTATRLIQDAGAIEVPTLVLGAGRDWVVKKAAQRKFFSRLGSPIKRMKTFAGLRHAILHERDRAKPIALIREFITETFEKPAGPPCLLEADRQGHTRSEYDWLRQPLGLLSPRRLSFALQKLALKTICRLSEGIRLGWRTGFDSGPSLDYVYQNHARGITPLGRLIDRIYLNSPGWTGIRHRKADLQATLRDAIEMIRASGRTARIVDIAAGGGRYLLEVLASLPSAEIFALLRDTNAQSLQLAKATAGRMELTNVTFAPGDAFNRQSLAGIEPRPNIAISSGLYELFPDNAPILRSLSGLADALEPGGLLIYTNQPWHPQIEMIARVLRNRDGHPWVMRRRTQAEMDQLVRSAGFEKLGMRIEPAGIFTVSLARRS